MEARRPSEPSADPSASSSHIAQDQQHSLAREVATSTARSNKPPSDQKQVPEPEAVHIPDDGREATELQPPETRRPSRIIPPSLVSQPTYLSPLKNFWRRHIVLSVPHVDCRDHLANERTFLGYLRTSLALSMMGVVIAQLWRLHHSPTPDPVFGFFVFSIPISVIFQCAAMIVVLLGGVRFWRQQEKMSVGRVKAGGWEVAVVGVGAVLLLTLLFVLHVGVDVWQTYRG